MDLLQLSNEEIIDLSLDDIDNVDFLLFCMVLQNRLNDFVKSGKDRYGCFFDGEFYVDCVIDQRKRNWCPLAYKVENKEECECWKKI